MNKSIKYIIVIVVLLIIAYVVYKLAFKSKFIKGYAKKSGEWVACRVKDYDKDYFEGINTAGVMIYFKRSDVSTRKPKDATATTMGLCADAVTDMNVYTLKA